ncbi:MAG TPA: Gfo/Idh/MocA family oxidoreductase [Chloroflexota bacterium]|nr:Gfo/Idh/MocA family oxidoreductase [Chloroflexota bacterium]
MSAPPTPPAPLVADPTRPLRAVLFGVQHSHAAGKARAMAAHPQVDLLGAYEADPAARARAQDNPAFSGLRWFDAPAEFLADPEVVVACVEGAEGRCVDLALQAVEAGKHIWYDKPAGDWPAFQQVVESARRQGLHLQMGYMLRYHAAFRQIESWARSGLLGDLYAVRGHMSTYAPDATRGRQRYPGGIAFQLASHMIDPTLTLFGARPQRVTSFLRNDATPAVPEHADNTLVVLEFERGLAAIDIAAMEAPPPARRFEVYGTRGSAIVLEPFEPGPTVRLCLVEPGEGFQKGEQRVELPPSPRQEAYVHELNAFVGTLTGRQAPDRTLDHELQVEETLHRAVGTIAP